MPLRYMLLSRRQITAAALILNLVLLSGCATHAQSRADFDLVTVPADEGAVTTYGVTWFPGVDALASSSAYAEADQQSIQGTLALTERSLTFMSSSNAAALAATGVHIRYSRIASIDIRHLLNTPAVLIKRRDGKMDSFQIRGTIFIDREQTEAAGRLLQSKIQSQPVTAP